MKLLAILLAFAASGLETVVKLDSGHLSGLGGPVRSYRGVPYAAAPVGSLRWKPAEPVKAWEGIRPASAFGPACPQAAVPPAQMAEDCLTLNVWTPAKGPGERLPVLVWIHGGGFRAGTAALPVYDGGALAGRGVVVVTINYRLGLLGFLAHPELSDEQPDRVSGNQGLTDMIQALSWVRSNIAAFGGDPANVTIMGESSGATAVALLMVSPKARGLFAKAVALSPWRVGLPVRRLRAPAYGRPPAEESGAALGALAELRGKSAAEILALPDRSSAGANSFQVIDGVLIPDDPVALLRRGAPVPTLVGSNRDEGTLFSGPAADLGPDAAALTAVYGSASDPKGAHLAALRDSVFTLGARTLARAAPAAWRYEFVHASGAGRRSGLEAFHGSEIPYFLGTLPATPYVAGRVGPLRADDFGPADNALSQAMSGYLLNFLKTGDPNGRGLARWPKASERAAYMEFAAQGPAARRDLREAQLDAIQAVLDGQAE